MLVGVLSGSSISDYHALTRNAPIQLIEPPVVYLSTPEEVVSRQDLLSNPSEPLMLDLQAVMFRNLYNPTTRLPGYYAAATSPSTQGFSVDAVRKLMLKEVLDRGFTPFFLIAHDGMRSAACRTFLRSFGNALASRLLRFQLTEANPSNPDHVEVFSNFNPEALVEFQHAGALGFTPPIS